MRRELARLPDYWKDAPLNPAWKEPARALRREVEQAGGLIGLEEGGHAALRNSPRVEIADGEAMTDSIVASASGPACVTGNQARAARSAHPGRTASRPDRPALTRRPLRWTAVMRLGTVQEFYLGAA